MPADSLDLTPSVPRNGGEMFAYRLHLEDGSDVGEATYPSMVKVGEELFFGNGRRFSVLDVVPVEEEDESPFVGLLQVEAAS
jgi:hypothetical protein